MRLMSAEINVALHTVLSSTHKLEATVCFSTSVLNIEYIIKVGKIEDADNLHAVLTEKVRQEESQ